MNDLFSNNVDFFYANEVTTLMRADEIDREGWTEDEIKEMFHRAFYKLFEYYQNEHTWPFIRMIDKVTFEIVVPNSFSGREAMNRFCKYQNLDFYKEDNQLVWYYSF